jgi:hypothetical protein
VSVLFFAAGVRAYDAWRELAHISLVAISNYSALFDCCVVAHCCRCSLKFLLDKDVRSPDYQFFSRANWQSETFSADLLLSTCTYKGISPIVFIARRKKVNNTIDCISGFTTTIALTSIVAVWLGLCSSAETTTRTGKINSYYEEETRNIGIRICG